MQHALGLTHGPRKSKDALVTYTAVSFQGPSEPSSRAGKITQAIRTSCMSPITSRLKPENALQLDLSGTRQTVLREAMGQLIWLPKIEDDQCLLQCD